MKVVDRSCAQDEQAHYACGESQEEPRAERYPDYSQQELASE